jgi:S-adenosylmethionine hydrolase
MADQAEPSPGGGLVPRPEPLPFNTRAYETTNRRYFRERVSSTFHGRDVFAPVAARLALGLSVAVLGLRLDSLLTIPIGRPRRSPDGVVGVVLHMDAYGNGVTNIREADVNLSTDSVAAGGRRLPLLATYGEAAPGQALALWGSSGTLEIAVRDGSAAKDLGLRRGDRVLVESSPRCPA